jgi:hypothetical protein
MTDIVERLRHWSHGLTYDPAVGLMHESAAEIARLREAIRRLADQDATLSVQGGSVTVTLDATLTDAEREAIESAAMSLDGTHSLDYVKRARQAATLRSLLARLAVK